MMELALECRDRLADGGGPILRLCEQSFDLVIFIGKLDIRASRHLPSTMFGSARTAAGGLFSTAGSEHAHLYGSTLLVPGGRRGCTSGCWRPDVTLPVDVRDHRLGSGALCRHDPGTADRHHADRLWLDQPGDSGGSVPPALDQLLLDGAQGQVRLEGHGPCLMPDREAGVPVRTLRCG